MVNPWIGYKRNLLPFLYKAVVNCAIYVTINKGHCHCSMVSVMISCFWHFPKQFVHDCSITLAGEGKESDPTDVSADTSPTRWLTHHRHITDTLPTRWSAHCQCVGQHTTDALADTLLTCWSKYFPFLTIILSFLSVGSKNNFIRKDENVIAK